MNLREYQSFCPLNFSNQSKVWIYQSNRLFSISEAFEIETILNEFIPRFVQRRILRLHSLVNILHDNDIPDIILTAEKAINRAYLALRSNKDKTDATQDALVIMATLNWKPKQVPEHLPLLHYQTVARVRNKVLKRLNETELFMFKHQQTHFDFEAFLITTALLRDS